MRHIEKVAQRIASSAGKTELHMSSECAGDCSSCSSDLRLLLGGRGDPSRAGCLRGGAGCLSPAP